MTPVLVADPADRPAWLQARRSGVTATDITAITGLSPYNSAYSLYWEKVEGSEDRPDSPRLRLGRDLEPLIVSRFMETIHPDPGIEVYADPSGLYRSGDRPWMLATPDRVLFQDNGMYHEKLAGVLECKSWADADREAWEGGPPPAVRAQVLWQLAVMDASVAYVAVLFLPSGDFEVFEVGHVHVEHRDELTGLMSGPGSLACEACNDITLLQTAGHEFWERVQRREPPSPDGSAATLAALRKRFPVQENLAAEVDPDRWRELANCREGIRAYKALAAEHEAAVRAQAGNASAYLVGGVPVGSRVTYSAEVKAHTRRTDYIRINRHGDDDDN